MRPKQPRQNLGVSDAEIFLWDPSAQHADLSHRTVLQAQKFRCMVKPSAVSGGGLGLYNISALQIEAGELVAVMSVGKPKLQWCMVVPGRCFQTVPCTSVQGTMSTTEQNNLPCWQSWRAVVWPTCVVRVTKKFVICGWWRCVTVCWWGCMPLPTYHLVLKSSMTTDTPRGEIPNGMSGGTTPRNVRIVSRHLTGRTVYCGYEV